MRNVLTDALSKAKTVAISGHTRPDGDCVGACLGLYNYLLKNYPDIEADVYLEPVPDAYKSIAGTDKVITSCEKDTVYDLFIALDCGDKERLSGAVRYFEQARRTLCIDHHISNRAFADACVVRPESSSTCELLFDLMDEAAVDFNTAAALYTGIICDTGCFKHTNTTRHTMAVAGALIEKGVNSESLMDEVFYQKTFMQNQLLGRSLLDSRLLLEGKMIISTVSRALLDAYKAEASDLEGVIDQLRVTKGVYTAALISENSDGSYKISMRSKDPVNVADIAASYGGGGHIRAAGATAAVELEHLIDGLANKVREQLESYD